MAKVDVYFDMVQNLNVTVEWFTYNNAKTYFDTDGAERTTRLGGWSVFGTYKIIAGQAQRSSPATTPMQPNSTLSIKDQSLIIVGLDWSPDPLQLEDPAQRLDLQLQGLGQEERHRRQPDLLPELLKTRRITKEK